MSGADDVIGVPSWGKKAEAAPAAPVFEPNAAAATAPVAPPRDFTTVPAGDAPAPPARATAGSRSIVITLPTGEIYPIDGVVLIGRDPQPRAGESVDQLIAIGAWEKSVSKTHAVVVAGPSGVTVRDRGSSNGTWVVRAPGDEVRCAPERDVEVRPGDHVRLGMLDLTIGGV